MSNRVRTRERRREREKQRQRNRQFLAIGIVAAVAVIAVILFVIANLPAEATIPDDVIAEYDGIPQSLDENGFPVLGNPDAPVKVMEFSSFDCSHCAEFYEQVTPALVDRARAGDISFTYAPLYGTGGIYNGEGAARAAICASKQDAFWPFHGALFTWQTTYANQAFDGNRLQAGASKLGLDMNAWNACLRSQETTDVLVAANGAASRLEGFTGTPTVTVNGAIVRDSNGSVSTALSDINAAIDAVLATAPRPATTETVPEPTAGAAEATSEATAEATSGG